jgi:hypothetical protein
VENPQKKNDSILKSKNDSGVPRRDTTPAMYGFQNFKNEFAKDQNGRIDSANEIPLTYIKSILKDSFDIKYVTTINPVDLIVNTDGYFFIIRKNCAAGGDCAVYVLLVFDIQGKFVRSQRIGLMALEEENSVFFGYKFDSDTSLTVFRIDYKGEADKPTDSIPTRIRLSLYQD